MYSPCASTAAKQPDRWVWRPRWLLGRSATPLLRSSSVSLSLPLHPRHTGRRFFPSFCRARTLPVSSYLYAPPSPSGTLKHVAEGRTRVRVVVNRATERVRLWQQPRVDKPFPMAPISLRLQPLDQRVYYVPSSLGRGCRVESAALELHWCSSSGYITEERCQVVLKFLENRRA